MKISNNECIGCDGDEKMVENAIIFSKSSGEILLSSIYGEIDPVSDDFNTSLPVREHQRKTIFLNIKISSKYNQYKAHSAFIPNCFKQ